jgi:ABC-type phosphate transport system ATPase subunit
MLNKHSVMFIIYIYSIKNKTCNKITIRHHITKQIFNKTNTFHKYIIQHITQQLKLHVQKKTISHIINIYIDLHTRL